MKFSSKQLNIVIVRLATLARFAYLYNSMKEIIFAIYIYCPSLLDAYSPHEEPSDLLPIKPTKSLSRLSSTSFKLTCDIHSFTLSLRTS